MRFYFLDSLLQAVLLSTAASYFVNTGTATLNPVVSTSLDIFDVASKVTIVGVLGLFLYLVNKERTSYIDKIKETYDDLLKLKDREIEKKDGEVTFWRDKFLEK
ncbi:hypothetical protein [Bernardetia sp.]|uniref:hypothetical protein n=1 Tax=Bernardetia sp. TaxID=1937974 RepID=UPI0025BB0BFA|nr:hypothetical protein [Bernardetia sp.]